jgi:hypothetical protein
MIIVMAMSRAFLVTGTLTWFSLLSTNRTTSSSFESLACSMKLSKDSITSHCKWRVTSLTSDWRTLEHERFKMLSGEDEGWWELITNSVDGSRHGNVSLSFARGRGNQLLNTFCGRHFWWHMNSG